MKILGVMFATCFVTACSTSPHFVAEQSYKLNDLSEGNVTASHDVQGGIISNLEKDTVSDKYVVTVAKTSLSENNKPKKAVAVLSSQSFKTVVDSKYVDELKVGNEITVFGSSGNSDKTDGTIRAENFYVWNDKPVYEYIELATPVEIKSGIFADGVWMCTDCEGKRKSKMLTQSLREKYKADGRVESEPPYQIKHRTDDY
ncbi:hypothetical protein [Kangiella shandongensis]|uniref:hypothetical protein n=1 Tax=Kangiella shandongensis TaxID=2763258 RepID=UPI001CBED1B1|nr:hypothetical protein [Kangiella shandongensis]